ncbi:MAG: hypothetical protein QOC61_2034, partial [Acidobacteriota bacterium]|nr:hypothetical protein [Acidobacteriota bacterium]
MKQRSDKTGRAPGCDKTRRALVALAAVALIL